MENSQVDLFFEVLGRLDRCGVLRHAVLIGSWCDLLYPDFFRGIGYASVIKTRDMDLLIPRPSELRCHVDVAELLGELGFIVGFTGSQGYLRMEHPQLILEFLVPERGRGTDKPYPLPQLGFNAQSLRLVEYLAQNTIPVTLRGLSITVPHPAYFALHKLMISRRRKGKDKAEKDIESARRILDALVRSGRTPSIRDAFAAMPRRWQSSVRMILEGLEFPSIESILESLQ